MNKHLDDIELDKKLDWIYLHYGNNLSAFFDDAIKSVKKQPKAKQRRVCANCGASCWLMFGYSWQCTKCKSWIFLYPTGGIPPPPRDTEGDKQ